MTSTQKRFLVVTALFTATVLLGLSIRIEPTFEPVDPDIYVQIDGSESWSGSSPGMVSKEGEPDAIYILKPELPRDDRFTSVRLDLVSGNQSSIEIALGPSSSFRYFSPADTTVEVTGFRYRRPSFYLTSLPDGKGPGFALVDAASGRISVKSGEGSGDRALLSGFGVNADQELKVQSLVSIDPDQKRIAAILRHAGGSKLCVFFPNENVAP